MYCTKEHRAQGLKYNTANLAKAILYLVYAALSKKVGNLVKHFPLPPWYWVWRTPDRLSRYQAPDQSITVQMTANNTLWGWPRLFDSCVFTDLVLVLSSSRLLGCRGGYCLAGGMGGSPELRTLLSQLCTSGGKAAVSQPPVCHWAGHPASD